MELFDLANHLGLGPTVDDFAATPSVLPAEIDRADPAAVGITAVDRAFAVPAALGSVGIPGHTYTPGIHGYIFGYIPGDKLSLASYR